MEEECVPHKGWLNWLAKNSHRELMYEFPSSPDEWVIWRDYYDEGTTEEAQER